MAFDRFLIAPLNSGLDTSLKSWLTPEDSFTILNNAYVFRGRVVKRFGSVFTGTSQLTSRLRMRCGTLAAPDATVPGIKFNVGQMFSVGALTFTVYQVGVPAAMLVSDLNVGTTVDPLIGLVTTGTTPTANGAIGQKFTIGTQVFNVAVANGALVTTGTIMSGIFNTATGVFVFTNSVPPSPAVPIPPTTITLTTNATGTFNTTTGAFVIPAAANPYPGVTSIYWYPSDPVMGLTVYGSGPIENQPAYAFDTQFSYVYTGSAWLGSALPLWKGTDINFFWAMTWSQPDSGAKIMFVSNFNVSVPAAPATDDPMYSFNGTTWASFKPAYMAAPLYTVETARIIISFKGRLLLLNTIEAQNGVNKAFVNRCRFSHVGDPLPATAPTAFYEETEVGWSGGNYVDASTDERIVTADFVKDRLIVYFERSTWELAFTGDSSKPFTWQRINTELGARSSFSVVPFDKYVLGIGGTGVHSCNGANVERIDNKIPDEIFKIENKNDGSYRVAGIRDYFAEMVYWTFPSTSDPLNVYPDRVLVYNYKNNSWAFNDDCITTFGYFEQQTDYVWENMTVTWENAGFSWTSGVIQMKSRQVIAGNQQGYIAVIRSDIYRNSPGMQLTNIVSGGDATVIKHCLRTGDYVKVENTPGTVGLNNKIFYVLRVDADTVTLKTGMFGPAAIFTGAYTGGGTLSRVSNIAIRSKQWNPYVQQGRDVYVAKIEFAVLKTSFGEITVDYSPSSTDLSMIGEAWATNSALGSSILETSAYTLYPLEKEQKRLWHPIYMMTEGSCIQIYLSFSELQITTVSIAEAAFEMEGLILHTKPTTSRMQ
jgi:hypothetical protein